MTYDKNMMVVNQMLSQSAFVRGFIDDTERSTSEGDSAPSLNPRSCAASSMT